jgi:hypothetical protein
MDNTFNFKQFTDTTKHICTCSAISIFLILVFILSPASHYFTVSLFMKMVTLFLLFYIIYLNYIQVNLLKNATNKSNSENINNQLNINIMCSYIFTIFIGLLIIFTFKSIFV